jgi:transcription factor IIIB subunit 2
MDLAERCSVNVWALGDTYKQLLECLMEKDPGDNLDGLHKIPQLEPLVLKFCRKLEFGIDSHRVAEDACRLLKRMKRDWMVDGRQPAGIIGAAIILAARMNNFRRTVREVVYCVKVADSTINQRLYEFRRTKSSNLTLSQWREYGLRLKDDVLPPAIYRRKEKEERKKRKLAALAGETEDISAYAQSLSANSPTRSQAKVTKKRKTTKATAQATASDSGSTQTDRDDNGFLIPDIPLNPQARPQDTMDFESEDHLEYVAAAAAPEEQLEDVEEEPLPLPKKRGRPAKVRKPIVIREDDLEIEAEIETDMQHNLRAWEHVFQEIKNSESHPVLQAAEDTAQALVREHMTTNVPETEIVGEDEFEDDPDVANCVNSPAEVAIKEKVWITQNEEWLREQQEKMLKKELQEAEGKTKKPKRKRKRYQMGDGSVLEGQPAASAAEAVSKMLQKRSNFSAHLNYDIVQSLFNMTGADNSAATSANGGSPAIAATPVAAASPAMSGASAQPTQHQPATEVQQDGEDEGDYDEEEEEVEEVYDEPIDDENQYMSEEEYGFDDMNDDF